MIFKENTSYVVIVNSFYDSYILSRRHVFPLSDIKIMNRNEVIDILTFTHTSKAITYLMKNYKFGFGYCENLLYNLKFVTPEFEELWKIKNELIKLELIHENADKSLYFKNKNVLVLSLEHDIELRHLLNVNNVSFSNMDLVDIMQENKIQQVHAFKSKFEQFMSVFSSIRKDIIENLIRPEEIVIYASSDSNFYIKHFANLFNIPIKLKETNSITSLKNVKSVIDDIFAKKTFEVDIPQECEYLLKIIEEFELKLFDDFNFAYTCLNELLSRQCVENEQYSSGVKVIDQPIPYYNSYVYVVDFLYGNFYKVFNDKDIFTDEELSKLNMNTSFTKTLQDRKRMLDYLTFNNFSFISYVESHLNLKIHKSQFVDELKLSVVRGDIDESGIYTSAAKNLLDSYVKDLMYAGDDELYKNYNYQYNGTKNNYNSDRISVTKIESYSKCPYSFYLSTLMQEYDENNFVMKLGTFVHSIFEEIFISDFDYDTEFSKSMFKNFPDCDNKIKMLLQTIKEPTRIGAEKLRDYYFNSDFKSHNAEESVTVSVNNKHSLNGRVDCVLRKVVNEDTFTIIIDFKSGTSGDLDLEAIKFGYSLQLPLYATYYKNNGEALGGILIYHPVQKYQKNKKTNIVEEKDDSLKLNGVMFASSEDLDIYDEFQEVKKGASIDPRKRKSNMYSVTRLERGDEVEILEEALIVAEEKIEQIFSSNFMVKPTKLRDKDTVSSCSYCEYRHICYCNDLPEVLIKEEE